MKIHLQFSKLTRYYISLLPCYSVNMHAHEEPCLYECTKCNESTHSFLILHRTFFDVYFFNK